MIALNRWIALAAVAAALPGLAGCKTGNSCRQTSCSRVACGIPQGCVGSTLIPHGHGVTPPGHAAPHSHPGAEKVIPEESFDAVPGPPGEEQSPAEEKAQPLPEPVSQIPTQPAPGSQFVPVSETRVSGGTFQQPAYNYPPRQTGILESSDTPTTSRASVQVDHGLSRPWSDALGLPAKNSQSVQTYGDR